MELTMFASPTCHAQRDWPIQAAHRLSNRVAEVAEQLQEPPHLLPPRRKRDEMDRKCLDTEVGGGGQREIIHWKSLVFQRTKNCFGTTPSDK